MSAVSVTSASIGHHTWEPEYTTTDIITKHDIILTSSNVPEKVVAGGLGLMSGLRVGRGSRLSHASL